MRNQLHIRIATTDDIPPVAAVLLQAFLEYRPLYTAEAFAATTPGPEALLMRWSEGPVWVATQNTMVTGTISVVAEDNLLYLRSMAVLPAASGQGIGWMLLEQAESYAVKNGFSKLYLFTTPFLHSAIRLYARAGFIHVEGLYDLAGTSLMKMEKAVVPG